MINRLTTCVVDSPLRVVTVISKAVIPDMVISNFMRFSVSHVGISTLNMTPSGPPQPSIPLGKSSNSFSQIGETVVVGSAGLAGGPPGSPGDAGLAGGPPGPPGSPGSPGDAGGPVGAVVVTPGAAVVTPGAGVVVAEAGVVPPSPPQSVQPKSTGGSSSGHFFSVRGI